MRVKGVDELGLHRILKLINPLYDDNVQFNRQPEVHGNWIHFTLRVARSDKPGARRSHQGRRMTAACWHVHRDFMWGMFSYYPEARLVTAMADYDGIAGFLEKFPATGDQNIGSMASPLKASEACDCKPNGYDYRKLEINHE